MWLRIWMADAGNLALVCGATHAVWSRYRQLLGAESAAPREARDAARARDEFLSLAAHELRTPLTSLELLVQTIAARGRRRARRPRRVIVRDCGPGIAAGERQRIFQRFHRGLSPTHDGGLGLGLSRALKIARMHGGDLLVDGEPGAGCTFMGVLSRSADPAPSGSVGGPG